MPYLNRRKFLHSILATSATASMSGSALRFRASGAPARFQSVRERLLRAIRQGQATGVSVAVVWKGEIIWSEGFGFADREHKVGATPDTPFSLASITKPFTATLVAALASERSLSLDAPAIHFLKTTPILGPNGDPNAVSIRMLGAHNSGLPGTFAAYLADGTVAAPSTEAFLKNYGRLAYPPGQIYEYGNIGFEALGEIVSGLTHQPFGAVMDRRLLQPLGMRNSFFSNAVDHIPSAAVGYDESDKRIPYYTTATPASGELYASAHDLIRFALFNLSQPSLGARRVLNDYWLRELHRPFFIGPRGIATTFGWFTGKLASGEPYLFKGGGQPGVAAKIFVLPSEDLACVVLTNRTDATQLVGECWEEIIQSYVPGFTVPQEDAGPAADNFVPTASCIGAWKGKLRNAGADQTVRFTFSAEGTATLGLSGRPPQRVNQLMGDSGGFEGITSGLIDCDHGEAFGSRTLVLKLVPHAGKLCGRVTARGTRPGLLLANLPYVLTLERA